MFRWFLLFVLVVHVTESDGYNVWEGDIFSELRFGSDKGEEVLGKFVSNFKKAKTTVPAHREDSKKFASDILNSYAKTLTSGIGANDELMKNLHKTLAKSANINDKLEPPREEEKPINSLGKSVVNMLQLQEVLPKNNKNTHSRRTIIQDIKKIKDYPLKQCYKKDNIEYCLNFRTQSNLESFRNKVYGRVKVDGFQDYQELLLASKEDFDMIYSEKKKCYKVKNEILCTKNMRDMFI